MKNVIIICFIFTIVTVSMLNTEFNKKYIALNDLLVMAQADNESGGYPIGKYCGRDQCSKACGMPPYVYTAYGHYWHCKWQDVPGSCLESLCEKECDAMCWK